MANDFDTRLAELIEKGTLPGGVFAATDAAGRFEYLKTVGKRSAEADGKPFTPDTRMVIASCTKLMTAVAMMQCAEKGWLDLDEPLEKKLVPELAAIPIIEGLDESMGEPILKANDRSITTRMLLLQTAGMSFDMMHPLLLAWHAWNKTTPWSGTTTQARCSYPLVAPPGSAWVYGVGMEWSNLVIQRSTGLSLEEFMRKHLWGPLGMVSATFEEGRREGVTPEGGIAEPGIMGEDLVTGPAGGYTMFGDYRDPSGAAGALCSAADYMKLLRAVLVRDERLLGREAWDELLRPRLEDGPREFLQTLLETNDVINIHNGMNVPQKGKKSYSMAGLVSLDDYRDQGWMAGGTVLWGGFSGLQWFIDREQGLCGLAAAQVFAFGKPPIHDMFGLWLRHVYELHNGAEK